MNNLTDISTKPEKSQYLAQQFFLQQIVENFEDGILVLTEAGKLVHGNASAYSICNQIDRCSLDNNSVPLVIWNLCTSLIDNQTPGTDNLIMCSEDIIVNSSIIFRLRVRRFYLDLSGKPYLLVTIENRCESLKNVAVSEANQYNLTQREAEIWSLYRATSSYKQIAEKLYITVNTVKKHLKNIRAKQQKFYPA